MAWESSQEQRPGWAPYQATTSRAGLPTRSVAVPRRHGALNLKYHGVVVAIPSARAPPHSRSRVVFALSPLCRAFPSCPCLQS